MTDQPSGAGALAGLRVLDTATLYAGPFISTILADHGAEVIKIEPPGGDDYRRNLSRMWPLLARNKQSVMADLRSVEGADLVRRLAADVDVVVVNMPQPLLERIGLDYRTLSGINPALIYVHVTGYGVDGPYAGRPGNGTSAEALAGLTHMTGDPDGPPVLASVPVGDAVTGYVGAFGVLAACYQRLSGGGHGQMIDVNPLDAVLQVVGPMICGYRAGGPVPGRLGSGLAGAPLRGVFGTVDGHWVAVSASTPRHLRDIAELCGYGEVEPGVPTDGLVAALRAWIAHRERDEVLSRFVAGRLPMSPIADAQDLMSDPHLEARGALQLTDTAEWGLVAGPAPAPRLLGNPSPARVRTPDLDEHGAEVRARAARSGSQR